MRSKRQLVAGLAAAATFGFVGVSVGALTQSQINSVMPACRPDEIDGRQVVTITLNATVGCNLTPPMELDEVMSAMPTYLAIPLCQDDRGGELIALYPQAGTPSGWALMCEGEDF